MHDQENISSSTLQNAFYQCKLYENYTSRRINPIDIICSYFTLPLFQKLFILSSFNTYNICLRYYVTKHDFIKEINKLWS